MSKIRYKVTGEKDGVPCGSVFKNLPAAKRFADSLVDSEVYDIETRKYIYGTSRFIHTLHSQTVESSNL